MLTLTHSTCSSNDICLVGIDPGSNTLGVGILTVNIESMEIVSSKAMTLNGDKLSRDSYWLKEIEGDRASRIMALEKALLAIFNYHQPIAVGSESPFINNHYPAAGIALTEVICAIRRAVMHYDIWRDLRMIPPSSVKNAIYAKGNADKNMMKEKILLLANELKYNGEVPLALLDEHSVDALAVTYCMFTELKNR